MYMYILKIFPAIVHVDKHSYFGGSYARWKLDRLTKGKYLLFAVGRYLDRYLDR